MRDSTLSPPFSATGLSPLHWLGGRNISLHASAYFFLNSGVSWDLCFCLLGSFHPPDEPSGQNLKQSQWLSPSCGSSLWSMADTTYPLFRKTRAMRTIQHSLLSPNLSSKWPSFSAFGFFGRESVTSALCLPESEDALQALKMFPLKALPLDLRWKTPPFLPLGGGGTNNTTAISEKFFSLN